MFLLYLTSILWKNVFWISGHDLCCVVSYDSSPPKESVAETGATAAGWPGACWAELQQLPAPASARLQAAAAAAARIQTEASWRLQAQSTAGDNHFHSHHQIWQGTGHRWKLQDCVSIPTYFIKYLFNVNFSEISSSLALNIWEVK